MRGTITKWIMAYAVALVIAVVWARVATSYLFIGNLVTVNNATNTTAPLSLGEYSSIKPTFYFQNAGLTDTNAMRAHVQLSIDSSNWITLATYQPSGTNATNEAFSPTISIPLYLRSQVITTNSVQVGATLRL